MPIQHNLDRNLETYNTKAPFRYSCALKLPNGNLPSQSIRAAVVYCYEDVVAPVRINSMSVDPVNAQCCKVEFTDFAGSAVGYAYLYKKLPSEFITTFILDQYDCITGHICYNAEAADAMLQAALTSGGRYVIQDNDFVLLPQCHIAMFRGILRAISVNGELTRRTVYFNPTIEMHTDYVAANLNAATASYSYIVSMAEVYDADVSVDVSSTLNGISWLAMNNLDSIDGASAESDTYAMDNPFVLTGVHLVIRASDTSNIRVISTDRYTTFTGVLDVLINT